MLQQPSRDVHTNSSIRSRDPRERQTPGADILNRVRDELRRKGRRPETTDLDGLEGDAGLSPLAAAIGREANERYEQALSALRPDEREATLLPVCPPGQSPY
jgi:hypothetical protein